jgi:histidinol dehydrogenase
VLPTREVAAAAWRDHGAVIVAPLEAAPGLIDQIAPEHVEFALADPERLAGKVRHAGAIFLGRHAPEALGDYLAGPNHVLPTSGAARFASGLSTLDFLKRTSIIGCAPEAFAALAPAAETLALAEGLPAHARSLSIRLNRR